MSAYFRFAVLTLFVAASAADLSASGGAVTTTLEDGTQISFPFFDQSIQTIDPKLKKMIVAHMSDLLTYLEQVIISGLNKPHGFMGWMKIGKDLISMGYSQKNARKALNNPYPKEREFNERTASMFKGLLSASKDKAKHLPEQTKDQVKAQVENFLSSLRKAVEDSDVGPYILFQEGMIGGRSFTDVTVDMMASLRNNGFESLLGSIDKLLGIMSML